MRHPISDPTLIQASGNVMLLNVHSISSLYPNTVYFQVRLVSVFDLQAIVFTLPPLPRVMLVVLSLNLPFLQLEFSGACAEGTTFCPLADINSNTIVKPVAVGKWLLFYVQAKFCNSLKPTLNQTACRAV